jgi:hypothetical protein
MRFQVPQFIDYEMKIFGPFTFRQFIFVAIAGAICFALYFTISFAKFLLITIILMGGTFALAFIKIEGRPITTILMNFLNFSVSPRIYLWRRKEIAPKFVKIQMISKKEEKKEEEKDTLPLKIAGGSRLKNLFNQIETRKQ